MKPTYNPRKIRTKRKFGFRARMETKSGRDIINRKRSKGRARLAL